MIIQPLPYLTAEEVRAFRRMLGLDQEKFAALLGVSLSSVENWERKGTQGRYRYNFAAIDAGLAPWSVRTQASLAPTELRPISSKKVSSVRKHRDVSI